MKIATDYTAERSHGLIDTGLEEEQLPSIVVGDNPLPTAALGHCGLDFVLGSLPYVMPSDHEIKK